MEKKQRVIAASYDRYTQEDVSNYHLEIGIMMKAAEKDGELDEWRRAMCRCDLYYLAVYELGYKFMYSVEDEEYITFRPWLFNRCWEVQNDPDFHVDVWARGHFKSTIITICKTIQDILRNPEITVCIYSYNADIAQGFVSAIRQNLESATMKALFPDIIPSNTNTGRYKTTNEDGVTETVKFSWSDKEFTVMRKSKRKEPTVMGRGLVNNLPTGYHFDLLVFDDVVTWMSVSTPEQNAKTYQRWQDALNTGTGDGTRHRIIGTFYALRDTYFNILNPKAESGVMGGSRYTLRKYPAMEPDGNTVLYSKEYIEFQREMMVGLVFSSQIMCDPQDASSFKFLEIWIPKRMRQEDIEKDKDRYNFFIIVDPANSKKSSADYTSMWVIATTSDKKYLLVDLVRTRLAPTERRDTLFRLVSRWTNSRKKPNVFYEHNSMSSDIAMIQEKQQMDRYYFDIYPASTRPKIKFERNVAGQSTKESRIMALEPLFRAGRIILMEHTYNINYMGVREDTTAAFLNEEYLPFPFANHDDSLDSLSRIADLSTGIMLTFPDTGIDDEHNRRMDNVRRSRRYSFDIPKGAYIPF